MQKENSYMQKENTRTKYSELENEIGYENLLTNI